MKQTIGKDSIRKNIANEGLDIWIGNSYLIQGIKAI